jgi:hypothetical protein
LTEAASEPPPTEPTVTLAQFQELKDEFENERIEWEVVTGNLKVDLLEVKQELAETKEQTAQNKQNHEELRQDTGKVVNLLASEVGNLKSEQNRRSLPPPQEPKNITQSAKPKPFTLPPANTQQTPLALAAKPVESTRDIEIYYQPAYNPPRKIREERVHQPSKLKELTETATTLFKIIVGILIAAIVVALLYITVALALSNLAMTIAIVLMCVVTLIAAGYYGLLRAESTWAAGFIMIVGLAVIVLTTTIYVKVVSSREAEAVNCLGCP